MTTQDTTALHLKYRPASLDSVIGHAGVVASLQGIVKSGKWPSAIAFFGPPSAGKTTLSKALAADVIGLDNISGGDYTYVNMGSERSIDDVRQLIQVARLSPMGGKRRFIHLDEAQGLVSNAAACLAAETLVLTSVGRITAKELHQRLTSGEDISALSFNHTTGIAEYKPFMASVERENSKQMVSVNGSVVTEDHRVFTSEQGYLEASTSQGLTGLGIERAEFHGS